jgi:diaminopimelate dehydrogenase
MRINPARRAPCMLCARMRRSRVAIIGFGRLGRAVAQALADCAELELAGIVRRGGHVRDLQAPEVALVCVPAGDTLDVAGEFLQQRLAVVECAALEGAALESHHAELMRRAARHRARAVVGAGWDPGVLTLLRRSFELLIPHGTSELTRRPALPLHHTAEAIPGVRAAVATEQHAGAEPQRYVYVELEPGTPLEAVQAAVAADPAFAGEHSQVFAVDSVEALAAEAHGVLLERRGSARQGSHAALVLEGRFDPVMFAARAMLDAARRLPELKVGGHRYALAI